VPVDLRSQLFLGFVQVHSLEKFKTNDAVKFGKDGCSPLEGLQIIACRIAVAGVDANPYPAFVLHLVNDLPDLFKGMPQIGPLAGRVFNHGDNPFGLVQGPVDRLGHQRQRGGHGNLVQVGSGVKIEPVETQKLTSPHLIQEGLTRLLQLLFPWMAQVDQVAVVGKNLKRLKSQPLTMLPEGSNALRGERFCHPLALVLGKQGEGIGPDGMGIQGRILHTPLRTHMCSDILHICINISNDIRSNSGLQTQDSGFRIPDSRFHDSRLKT